MRKTIVLALVPVLAVAGCGSRKDANKANFAKALDAHFASHCIAAQLTSATGSTFPMHVTLARSDPYRLGVQGNQRDQQAEAPYEALVTAGLLSAKNGSVEQQNFMSPTKTVVPARIFALTTAGKKALAPPSGFGVPGFCAGHYVVEKVVRFTPPNPSPMGKMSQVVFTFGPSADVPAWAHSKPVQAVFPDLVQELRPGQRGEAALVLTNNGWMDATDFSR